MIVVCGEALIDLFVHAGPDGTISTEPVAGGSPYNVAIGLKRLGTASAFFGGLSRDAFGTMLASHLEKERVDLRLAPRLANPTTLVIVSIDAAGVPTYRFVGEGAADRALTLADLPETLPDGVEAITFGSMTMAVEPVGSTYLALAQREAGKRIISVDPNLRISVVGDIGRWRQRLEAFIATANIVKSSIEDIEGTYPGEDVGQVVERWRRLGPSLVIVTRGAEGAAAYWQGGVISVPGRKVAVVDTVGAGDTFHAGLLNQFERTGRLTPRGLAGLTGDELLAALHFAAAAAAVTCTRRGADMARLAEAQAELTR
jgi:fructokinase